MTSLAEENAELRDQLAKLFTQQERLWSAVLLHHQGEHPTWVVPRCVHCAYDWPCPTVRVSQGKK